MTGKTTAPARVKIDPRHWSYLKDIIADALEQKTATARLAVVEERCANDPKLRDEARSLVRAAEELSEAETDSLEDCAEHATANLWHDEPSPAGWRIGAYMVTRELGRGGMGTVYLAARADGQFEKDVAIKVLKRGTDTDEVLCRFSSERHILARLDHPNIARLLDAGTTDDGLPYFVMEYVAGAPVTRFLREHELPIADRLAIFLKICAAVEVAHHHHVIHRDLKPSNILVNAEGEPKLLDFGIAKLLIDGQESVELTAAGEQRLTPICASPEQANGRPVTEASDVYALGALLYEMLSGEKPCKFSSAHPSREEIARVVREQDPAPPSIAVADRETSRSLRGDLDAIVLHALRKEPECRYPTVTEFAADVRHYLAHEPVQARGHGASYRAKFLISRKQPARRAAIFAAAAAIALLALLGGGLWMRSQEKTRAATSPVTSKAGVDLPKSIAVLPFDNFGDHNPPSYFADGVQDNILTDLGKVEDLKVISRSGVAAYRGKVRDVKQIGRELGVANILEGSVQISGDRVRINAQLVDTRTDAQIWAEHYDRKVEDIFALQSELAQTIVAQLKATLSSREKAAIWKQPTQDLQAYDLYLRARSLLHSMDGNGEVSKRWLQASELLHEAISRDANFALAYCLLNEAEMFTYHYGDDHTPARLSSGRVAAETALRLEPGLEEAHIALARYYYLGPIDYRQTLDELAKLDFSGAHDIEFFSLASLVERRLGLWKETVRDGERALELDPQNSQMAFNLIQTLTALKSYDDSARVLNSAILKASPRQATSLLLLRGELEIARGDLPQAHAALDAAAAGENRQYPFSRLWLFLLERDFAGAKTYAANLNSDFKTSSFWVLMGTIARANGEAEEARHDFAEGKRLILRQLQRRPDSAETLSELGIAEAGLGNKDEALRAAQQAVNLLPISKDAVAGPMIEANLAEVYAWTGDHNSALEILAQQIKVPFGESYGDLNFNPIWDELRADPRYRSLVDAAASLIGLTEPRP